MTNNVFQYVFAMRFYALLNQLSSGFRVLKKIFHLVVFTDAFITFLLLAFIFWIYSVLQ